MIPTIIKADIGPIPKVTATFSDGTTEDEFVGLTAAQARQLKHGRDVDYIQS